MRQITMTVTDVAWELQTTETNVRKLINNETIPHRRVGGLIRVLRSEFLDYLGAKRELEELKRLEAEKSERMDSRAIADRWKLNRKR